MMSNYDHIFVITNDIKDDRRMKRICSTLAENGQKVLIIGRIKPDSKELDEQRYDQHRIQCYYNKGPLFYLEFNLRTISYLLRLRMQTLTCVDFDTILIGGTLIRLKRFKFYFDAHEYFTEVPELGDHKLKKKIWEVVGKFSIKHSKVRYTVCDSLADIFQKKYNLRFSVIKNVPEKIKIKRKRLTTDNPFIITYLGVLNEGRGLEQIITSLTFLPDCILFLIGDGDIALRLKEKITDNDVAERVVFYGQLSEEHFGPILMQSHLGINLLDSKSKNYYYSLANKFFDYLNYELPVLTMNFPEYSKINDKYKCCHLIDTLEISEIVKAINSIRIPEYYCTLRNNSLMAKEDFHWDNEKSKLLGLYSKS